MCVCVCTLAWVPARVPICAWMRARVQVQVCLHVCVHMRASVSPCVRVSACTCTTCLSVSVCLYLHVCVCVCVCMCVCVHVRMHARRWAHRHIAFTLQVNTRMLRQRRHKEQVATHAPTLICRHIQHASICQAGKGTRWQFCGAPISRNAFADLVGIARNRIKRLWGAARRGHEPPPDMRMQNGRNHPRDARLSVDAFFDYLYRNVAEPLAETDALQANCYSCIARCTLVSGHPSPRPPN